MTCLHLHSSLFLMHTKLKPQQQHRLRMEHNTKLLWGEPSKTMPHSKHFSSVRTQAIPDFIVVAATSLPKPADPSTFLPCPAYISILHRKFHRARSYKQVFWI
ncbi:hypothetical protein MTR_5g093240 [Medicago truncatula]|uniref:Transmembrane protein n=1 Tax=Medicago truncatula TaxID=3880 RepID=A0A072UFB0_MEDTR|nr:hypothetical protein MTR_5g093240 [Medicago truncatula]